MSSHKQLKYLDCTTNPFMHTCKVGPLVIFVKAQVICHRRAAFDSVYSRLNNLKKSLHVMKNKTMLGNLSKIRGKKANNSWAM